MAANPWTALAPTSRANFNADTMLLLTDGSVMVHELSTPNWHRYTPDALGNYVNGKWSPMAALPDNPAIPAAKGGPANAPLYFASAVLKDGNVFVAGGEYNGGIGGADLLSAQIYNPVTDKWHLIPTPANWNVIGDAPCCVLPDGLLLLGNISTTETALYDPAANHWTAVNGKDDASSEETWTLLADHTVLTAECRAHPKAEKYVASSKTWVPAGVTLQDLVEASSIEIGPAVLLPDGRVFAVGATGHTGLYTPTPNQPAQPGTWHNGPDFPKIDNQQLIAKDAPACLLPTGQVLCTAGPASEFCPQQQGYCSPTYFFEYHPSSNTLAQVPQTPNNNFPPYVGRMLLLPTGQVMYSNNSTDLQIYTAVGKINPAWKPRVTCPKTLKRHHTFTLHGEQFNGMSQAVSYGDDATMATNYPLVRIVNVETKHVVYCRTFNHSSMGVATGTSAQSTQVAVPAGIGIGPSELFVVANGIASDPCHIQVIA